MVSFLLLVLRIFCVLLNDLAFLASSSLIVGLRVYPQGKKLNNTLISRRASIFMVKKGYVICDISDKRTNVNCFETCKIWKKRFHNTKITNICSLHINIFVSKGLYISVKQNFCDLRHFLGLQIWFMKMDMDQEKLSIQSVILFHFSISWRSCNRAKLSPTVTK